jgi:hypothetical protein
MMGPAVIGLSEWTQQKILRHLANLRQLRYRECLNSMKEQPRSRIDLDVVIIHVNSEQESAVGVVRGDVTPSVPHPFLHLAVFTNAD